MSCLKTERELLSSHLPVHKHYMKVAITADAHLREERSERLSALEEVFKGTHASSIEHLIIAGDLFDENPELALVNQFKELVEKFPALKVHVILGNHDPGLSSGSFALDNLKIYSQPGPASIVARDIFMMMPYLEGSSMGDELAGLPLPSNGNDWILIGHGDYMSGNWKPNPLESKHGTSVYMPLQRGDLEFYKPKRVFLGHIHKPTPVQSPLDGWVLYPGSPHGLDVTETGRRRFLIYDDEANEVEEHWIKTGEIFYNETFLMVPADEELATLGQAMAATISGWGLTDEEMQRVSLRANFGGFCQSTLMRVQEAVGSICERVKGPGRVDIKTEKLRPEFHDPRRRKLAEKVIQKIELLAAQGPSAGEGAHDDPLESWWEFGDREPSMGEVKQAALDIIYLNK